MPVPKKPAKKGRIKKKEKKKKDPYDEVVDELIKYDEGTPSRDPKYEYGEMEDE